MLADTTAVSDTSQDEINPSDKTAVSDTPEASLTWRCFVAHQRYVIHWIFQNQRSEKSGICPGLMVEVLRFRLMIFFSRRMTPRESPMEWDSYDSLPTGTGSFRYHCDCFFGSTIFKKKQKWYVQIMKEIRRYFGLCWSSICLVPQNGLGTLRRATRWVELGEG